MLHFVGRDPVDSSVSSDCFVVRVDQNNFKEFVCSVLSYPIGVEHSQISGSSADSFFSDSSVGSVGLELADTLVDGFSIDLTLVDGLLSSSTSNSDSVDNVSLLLLIAELSGLVRARRSLAFVNHGQLSILPCSHSEHKAHHIGLLLSPKLFQVLVCTHFRILNNKDF